MEHIEGLEKELFTKNEVIEDLRKEKQIKAEETKYLPKVIISLLSVQHNFKHLTAVKVLDGSSVNTSVLRP